jgi:hypothetical protein
VLRPVSLRIVRDFLLHGPATIAGADHSRSCLAAYNIDVTKRIQKRLNFNVALHDETKTIRSPALLVNGLVLNQTLACVCDAVHWSLTDFMVKRLLRCDLLIAPCYGRSLVTYFYG